MKKSIYFCTRLFIVAIFFHSCKKEEQFNATVSTTSLPKVRINTFNFGDKSSSRGINGVGSASWIVFETVAEYENLVDTLTEEEKINFVEELKNDYGFISLNETGGASADTMDEEFFGGILNPNGVVQISRYLIKINPITGYSYVMDSLYKNEYSDLVNGNTNNPHILQYSNDEDFFEDLSASSQQKCDEARAPARNRHQYFDALYGGPATGHMKFTVYHKSFLIFRTLGAKAALDFSVQAENNVDSKLIYGYQKRCRDQVGLTTTNTDKYYYNPNTYCDWAYFKIKGKVYDGTRALSRFYINAKLITGRDREGIGCASVGGPGAHLYVSDFLSIQYNW